ncbi:hypothetical protein [Paenarthrobacter sp. CAP02]|uniref:hypothetical protein n=1 Tax=Paenarthrobacter sp. CAP02 TaxID=3158144 RepID=UPI0032DACF40
MSNSPGARSNNGSTRSSVKKSCDRVRTPTEKIARPGPYTPVNTATDHGSGYRTSTTGDHHTRRPAERSGDTTDDRFSSDPSPVD